VDNGFEDDLVEPEEHPGRREAVQRRSELRLERVQERRRQLIASAPWITTVVFGAAALVAIAGYFASAVVSAVLPAAPAPTGPRLLIQSTFRSQDATSSQPTGVALSGDRLYVADPVRRVVDVYSRDGSHVATIGAGVLDVPVYVAVGPVDGRVYVSDRGLGTVEVFASDGTPFGVLDPDGLKARETTPVSWRPLGLAFGSNGTLYVADSSDEAHIAVYSAAGSRIGTMGADVPPGRSGRPLAFPNGIVVTSDQVIVADSNNGRLVYFTRDGVYLRALMVGGMPRGIATLEDGGLLISDAAFGDLDAYDAEGEVEATLAHVGVWGSILQAPAGVAVDPDGRMFVADAETGEIAVVTVTSTPDASVSETAQSRSWILVVAITCALIAVAAAYFGISRARARTREGETGL